MELSFLNAGVAELPELSAPSRQRHGNNRYPQRRPLSLRMGFAALHYGFNLTEFTTPCCGSHQASIYSWHKKKKKKSIM